MSAPLYIHRYRLTLRLAGNALSTRRVLEGFLIRCGNGFGCVHPWPELGDPDVEELLAALRDGKRHRLLDRALACAAEDGTARSEGRSLFGAVVAEDATGFSRKEDAPGREVLRDAAVEFSLRGNRLRIPRSHATITGDADFPALAAAGFTTVKLKTHGADPALRERVAAVAAAGLRVRIDCNGTGVAMLAALRTWADSVDFIEDPEPYHAARWRAIREQFGFRLALDRLDSADAGGYDVRVLKPALETCEARCVPVVFTGYMDHPLGQMWAALEAARYAGEQRLAGLLTHHLFEPDDFIEAVRSDGPQLLPPGGTGLGFDALLETLPWDRINGSATFPQRSLLLTNPRAPLEDPPGELPGGCLVFQTSGSTGAPSLVCLSHEAMRANAAAVNDWLGATSADTWLRVLPEFHVGGMSIRFRAELSRSRAMADEEKWDATRFVRTVEAEGVTLTSLVPAQVFDLVAAGLESPGTLRAVIVGGGSLEASLFEKARTLGWPLLPSFGMTEASSQVATARPGARDSLPPLELLPCWEARVNDEGRLQLRGTPLLSGRFTRSGGGWEFSRAVDDDGWFTTNDRAALHGQILTPLGRCDRTVKILGELVDLDAIESALTRAGMPPNRGAVIALPDERAGAQPWLVTDLCEAETPALVATANESLPPFSKIAGCRHLADLPRSPLGKVLRSQL